MNRLIDLTIQRQNAALSTKVDTLQSQVTELTNLLRKQSITSEKKPAQLPGATVITGPVTAATTNTTNVVQVFLPWDGDRRIGVETRHIAAAFAENARLQEYAHMGDHELADPEVAPPYVTELLMDLVRRAHADPAARNVYLNPRRADQALVHLRCGRWEVLPLAEATRLLFDGVAGVVHRVTLSWEEMRRLPMEAQNALAIAGLMYDGGPEEYVRRARAPMAAHLANVAPARAPAPVPAPAPAPGDR